ncbi:MAG TPA: thioredoxin domain-containing protein [Pseudonocardiaceae bacterium]|jgi:hypothetical protein|nr:thioredoxin domain-containing protein [Pseudonocardiaceae bacterium]
MTNRLADATSPYLLQHAENPVDWWPWSPAAFAEAKRRDVPVLLSVGYAACHWCHVMAHESFEDAEIAALMNENFVSVKVDREERPDVDAVYMEATQAMSGHGGWPMTCFLTPDGQPFHCGTYYPPTPRHGMPSFRQLLEAVGDAWLSRRSDVEQAGAQVVRALRERQEPLPAAPVGEEALAGAVVSLLGEFDRTNAGFGPAPKFPPSMVLEFLLRHHERTGSVEALSMARATGYAMAAGGMCDQLGGGFCRYSVDAGWVVPHFEKMLYDNALLLRAYTHLARLTNAPSFRRVATETAEFLLRELRTPQGGFAAALDADADGVEGLTYAWTPEQLTAVLGPDDGPWAAELFGVTAEGTFEHGASTLRLPREPEDQPRFQRIRAVLFAARLGRPQPARDDKVIAAWNGLAIGALAEAGMTLDRPNWVAAAEEAARFLLDTHLVRRRLLRTSRLGAVGSSAGVLDDYGCLADGLLAVHQATARPHWLAAAVELLDTALRHFTDPDNPGSFFDTADDAEKLVRRPADPSDNASPAGASALAGALLTASALVGPDRAMLYRGAAEQALSRAGLLVARAPRFAGHWAAVAEALAAGPVQVAIVGPADHPELAELRTAAAARVTGGSVLLAGEPDQPGVPLLAGRPLVGGHPAAYVCRGYVCERPVTSAEELAAALKS